MAKVELTTKIIKETVCPQEKQYIYIMDSTVPGFALQVTRGGVKSYAVRYQSNGTRHSKVFAPVDKLSLAATRTRAKEILAAYTIGQDPFAKKANGNNMTIKALFDAWQVWAKEHKTSRPTVLVCQKALQKYFDLSRKVAESLTSHDLRQFQSARTKAGLKPSSINHYVTVLRYVYRWGMAQGLISAEYKFPPVKDLSEAEILPKTHHLSQDDIQKLINEAMHTGKAREHLRWIILFMLNTGIRPASICGLRWSDIIRLDNDGGEIRLRASNIKTKKM